MRHRPILPGTTRFARHLLPLPFALGILALIGAHPAASQNGKALYAQHCAACHGANGKGTSIGSDLSTSSNINTDRDIIRNGKGTMPGFKNLSTGQIQAIAEYVAHDIAGSPDPTRPNPSGPTGKQVYAAHCAVCHAANGKGTSMGPDLSSSSDASAVRKIVQDGKGTMPAFKNLSANQIQAVADYVATEIAGAGGRPPGY